MKWLKSLFTDADWDFDITKVLGFALVIIGLIGYFKAFPDFKWFVVTGCTMIVSGKFSQQG